LKDWYPANEWRDAYVVIPDTLHNCTTDSLSASFGDAWPTIDDTEWTIEMRNPLNVVVASYGYTHTSGQRNFQVNMGNTPFTLVKGYTLNIRYRDGLAWLIDQTSKGYSLTLTVAQ